MSDTSEILKIIDRAIAVRKISEAQACRELGLKRDGIRTIRRGHPPKVATMKKLAEWLEVPETVIEQAITGTLKISMSNQSTNTTLQQQNKNKRINLKEKELFPFNSGVGKIDKICRLIDSGWKLVQMYLSKREFGLAHDAIEALKQELVTAQMFCITETYDEASTALAAEIAKNDADRFRRAK